MRRTGERPVCPRIFFGGKFLTLDWAVECRERGSVPSPDFPWFRPWSRAPVFLIVSQICCGEHTANFVNLGSRLVTLARGAPCRKPTEAARRGFGLIG